MAIRPVNAARVDVAVKTSRGDAREHAVDFGYATRIWIEGEVSQRRVDQGNLIGLGISHATINETRYTACVFSTRSFIVRIIAPVRRISKGRTNPFVNVLNEQPSRRTTKGQPASRNMSYLDSYDLILSERTSADSYTQTHTQYSHPRRVSEASSRYSGKLALGQVNRSSHPRRKYGSVVDN